MKAALYHRVSTLDQDPELARAELAAAAAARGLEVVMRAEETGSGARNDRPELQRVMQAALRGDVGAVVVWKLDRFGRSALDLLSNINALQGAGVRFIATTQGLDVKPGGDAISRLMLTVLAGVAEFERELIRERTRLGLDKARREGQRLGRRPREFTPQQVVAIGRLVDGGWGAYVISKETGLPESSVRRYVRRLQASARKGPRKRG
jgi:putative DNA-invertase from lambdoid prophage Rac